jgi:PII-like signaling protein
VIEIVDNEPNVQKLLPALQTMVTEGMITMEHVTILAYRSREKSTAG